MCKKILPTQTQLFDRGVSHSLSHVNGVMMMRKHVIMFYGAVTLFNGYGVNAQSLSQIRVMST